MQYKSRKHIQSKIAEHWWAKDHRIKRNKADMMHKEANRIIRKPKKSVIIHQNNKNKPSVNRA